MRGVKEEGGGEGVRKNPPISFQKERVYYNSCHLP